MAPSVGSVPPIPPSDATKPTILLLSLDKQPYFDELYTAFINRLSSAATLQRASTPQPALRYLAAHTPRAILVTDPAVAVGKHGDVLQELTSYVQNGGTAVFGAMFSSFIEPPAMNAFFKDVFNLPWQSGTYQRTTVHLCRGAQNIVVDRLPASYSQKALFLKNVAAGDAVYMPNSESEIEVAGYAIGRVDQEQTPVAVARVKGGEWRIGAM